MKIVNIKEKIISWIKTQVKEAKVEGIVMGLSGGLDSSVVAVLSKKAIGKNLLCLIMPCCSDRRDIQDAKIIAKKFELRTKIIDLCEIYNKFISILPQADTKTKGNLKARLRMVTLYYFANKSNYIVAGTGNKSEFYTGYFTKYGDSAADILPIADLYKRQVKNLARTLGIPARIINRAPSAGLWPGQTDEEELGITYDDLDEALSYILLDKRKKVIFDDVKKVKKIILVTEHKRNPPAICILSNKR
jgi:NAD+ synthase